MKKSFVSKKETENEISEIGQGLKNLLKRRQSQLLRPFKGKTTSCVMRSPRKLLKRMPRKRMLVRKAKRLRPRRWSNEGG